MFDSLIDNLGSLFLALLLAVMVWMVAVNQGQGPPVRKNFPQGGLIIEATNIPDKLVLFDQLSERVVVEVRAPQEFIERLSVSDFEAYVDLSGLSPGRHEVPVQVQCPRCAQKRVNVLGWTPNRISVRLDEAAERLVPVDLNLQGGTAIGYQAEPPVADPQQVKVSGPRSLVNQVSAARADIYLFNEDSTVQKEVSLVAVDADGNLVTGVTLEPHRVNVIVSIVPEGRRKEVAVTPVISGTVASGYYASGISVEPQTVVLTGPKSRIENAPGYVETDPVSIQGAKDLVEVQVPIRVPAGLQLVDPTQHTVTVRVEVSPFTGGRDFEVSPLIQNLQPGLRVEVSPPRIQVFLSGPVPDLDALTEEDILVILDLSGRQPGRHRIRPTVQVGRESLQVRTLPELVDVNITAIETPTPEATLTPKFIR
ncbi:MAG: hypothetical protein D6791_05405 [Chloroflexi bacterium]|nr:MAG: hypothetical protein D6791_05405 [Chloroflexota bacterium]